jgi:hypothetical protein
MTQFVITGPIVDDELLYWNNDWGWTSLEEATTFDKEIMTVPLPVEGSGVMEVSMIKEPVKYYQKGTLSPTIGG